MERHTHYLVEQLLATGSPLAVSSVDLDAEPQSGGSLFFQYQRRYFKRRYFLFLSLFNFINC